MTLAPFLCCPVDGCAHQIPVVGGNTDDRMVTHIIARHDIPELSAAWHTTHALTVTKPAGYSAA